MQKDKELEHACQAPFKDFLHTNTWPHTGPKIHYHVKKLIQLYVSRGNSENAPGVRGLYSRLGIQARHPSPQPCRSCRRTLRKTLLTFFGTYRSA